MISINWNNLSQEKFLQEYWQKKPLFLKAAATDLDKLIDGNELAGLSLEDDVESRIIYQTDYENLPQNKKYHLDLGPFNEDSFANYGESHWTLLVQAVNHYVPELSHLLQAFTFIPNWLIDDIMISYSTPQGGVGAHFDQYDVFLIQASGTRDWHIGQMCDGSTALVKNSAVKLLKDFKKQESFLCEPGDLLYLPPGLAHHGIATSSDCITYSVGSRAPAWQYLIERLSDKLLEETTTDDLFSSKNINAQASGLFKPDLLMAGVQERINHFLQSEQAQIELCKIMSEPKYEDYEPEPNDDIDEQILDALLREQQCTFWRDEASYFLYSENHLALYINGQCEHETSSNKNTQELVHYLADNYVYDTKTICELSSDSQERYLLLKNLIQKGYIYITE